MMRRHFSFPTRSLPGRSTRGRLARCSLLTLFVLAAFPTLAVAQTPGEVVEYYHLDALGSVRVVTNQAGAVVRRHDFKPFGEEVNVTFPNPDRKLFTGQERDQETALDYFGARYYRANIGRFTTVDPDHIGGEVGDPQSRNAYASARNNPLRFIDPDGRRWFTKNGNAVWVEPNKDGSYTSPGEGWVELKPEDYNYGRNVAWVDGVLSWIGEDPAGRRYQESFWMEQGLQDTTFSFLAPIQVGAAVGVGVARTLAANRLPSIAFKLLTPAGTFTKDVVRLAIVRQVILKQVPVGQVMKGVIVLEGRTLSYTAFRDVTGNIVVASIRLAK